MMKEQQSGYAGDSDNASSFDPVALYYALREKLWLIILCTIVFTALAVLYAMITPKTYVATAVVEVASGTEQKTVNIQDVKEEDSRTMEYLKTIEQSLESPGLLVQVARQNKVLDNKIYFPDAASTYSDDAIARKMKSVVSSKLRRGTRLIDLSVRFTDPEQACRLAEAVVNTYIQGGIQRRLDIMSQANKVLSDEAEVLRAKLQASEEALQAYMEKNHAVSLNDTQDIVVDQLKELNLDLTRATGDRLKAESDYGQYLKIANHPPQDLLSIASIASAPAVVELKKEVAAQEAEIANLSKRYRSEHPKYIQAKSQLADLEKSLDKGLLEAATSIKTAYESAQSTETKLQDALKGQEQRAIDLNKMSIPYNVLEREVDSDRALYEAVLKRLKEADVTKGIVQEDVQMVDKPVVPVRPVAPKKHFFVAIGVIAGLTIGCGIAYLLFALDGSFKTVDEAESKTGLPVIAAVPRAKKKKFNQKTLALVTAPRSSLAEAFRSLRTALFVRGADTVAPKVTLFTSAVPSEGKSFCASNYAVALAQQECKTLIIDADLRKPRVGKAFDLDVKAVGLTDCLNGSAQVKDAVHSTAVKNLFVMPAGSNTSKPAELLAGGKMPQVLRDAMQEFEFIVVDSAPINAVSDTLLLVNSVQAICLVIRAGATSRRAVQRAHHEIAQAGGKELRIVLNYLPRHGGGRHYYHYSLGEYGDKAVYGEKAGAVA